MMKSNELENEKTEVFCHLTGNHRYVQPPLYKEDFNFFF